jgi:hypothetical protein
MSAVKYNRCKQNFNLKRKKKNRPTQITPGKNILKCDIWAIKTWKQTWGMLSNNGVRNKSAQVIMIPETIADTPDFAPLSWLTVDLEKEPA